MASRKERVEQIVRGEKVLEEMKISYLKEFYPDCIDLIADDMDWDSELHEIEVLLGDDMMSISKEEAKKHAINVPSRYDNYTDEMML